MVKTQKTPRFAAFSAYPPKGLAKRREIIYTVRDSRQKGGGHMEHTHDHEYMHAHGITHTHEHEHVQEDVDELDLALEHEHAHHHHLSHHHSPEEKKRHLNRLSRVIGHLQHVKRMIEDDQDCADVLMQLSASRSALTGLGKEIINEHITHCITHAVRDGDMEAIEEFQKAIEKFC